MYLFMAQPPQYMRHYTMVKLEVICILSFCCFEQNKVSNIYQYFVGISDKQSFHSHLLKIGN